jgi:adenylate cyclase class 2
MKSEIEVKFIVANIKSLNKILRTSGFRISQKRTHEFNTIYDLIGKNGMGELRLRGELLRLRKNGRQWVLTHKGKAVISPHKKRAETEIKVEDGEALAKILSLIGFVPTFRYEKYRTIWTDGHGEVMLDETPIGMIAEIEGTSKWIDRTAAKLGISKAQYSTASYATMFFEWKHRTGSSAQEMTWKAIGKIKNESFYKT